MTLTTFTAGTKAKASEVNDNFTYTFDKIARSAITTAMTQDFGSSNRPLPLSKTIAIGHDGSNIVRTTNGGTNWSTVAATVTTGGFFYVNPNDCNYIVYYTSDYNGAAKYSTNAGASWGDITRPTDSDGNYIAYSITDTGRIYSIYDDTGNTEVAYTDNHGTSWTVVTDPGTAPAMAVNDKVQIASPKNICIAYFFYDSSATDTFGGYSLDTGANWTERVDTGSTASTIGISHCLYIDSTHYFISIYLDTVATENGIYIYTWGTVTESGNDPWEYVASTVDTYRILIKFTSTEFIYLTFKNLLSNPTYLPRIYYYNLTYNANYTPIMLPHLFCDRYLQYHGVGISGVSRYCTAATAFSDGTGAGTNYQTSVVDLNGKRYWYELNV